MPDTVNQKISELPEATSPGNNDVLAGVQGSTTKKFKLSNLKTFFQNGLVPTSRKVNNKALSSDITLDKSDVGLGNVANVLQYSAENKPTPAAIGAVPETRTVNGKALSSNVSLDKSDIGLGNVANVLQYSASNKPSAANVTYSGTVYGLSATDVKGAIDELAIEKQESIAVGAIDLSLSWSGSGPYTQTVTILGPTVTGDSIISLLPTASQLAQLITDGVTALTIENNDGVLTAYALGAAPSTAMSIECTVTEGRWPE